MKSQEVDKLFRLIKTAGYLGLFMFNPPQSKQIRKMNRKVYNDTLKDLLRQVKELKAMK